MSKQLQEVIVGATLVLAGVFVIGYVVTRPDTPAITKVDTAALDIAIVRNIATKAQADADEAMALCGDAWGTASLADAKADWLRAHMAVLYRRLGQEKQATRLMDWPGGRSEPMKEIEQ